MCEGSSKNGGHLINKQGQRRYVWTQRRNVRTQGGDVPEGGSDNVGMLDQRPDVEIQRHNVPERL